MISSNLFPSVMTKKPTQPTQKHCMQKVFGSLFSLQTIQRVLQVSHNSLKLVQPAPPLFSHRCQRLKEASVSCGRLSLGWPALLGTAWCVCLHLCEQVWPLGGTTFIVLEGCCAAHRDRPQCAPVKDSLKLLQTVMFPTLPEGFKKGLWRLLKRIQPRSFTFYSRHCLSRFFLLGESNENHSNTLNSLWMESLRNKGNMTVVLTWICLRTLGMGLQLSFWQACL